MATEDRAETLRAQSDRRRRARDSILDMIAAPGDPTPRDLLRVVLMSFEEIGDKIDTILANERGLRETVLNGHAEVHPMHHEWIEGRIKSGCVQVCEWSREKMLAEQQEEKESAEIRLAGKKKFAETIVAAIVSAAISGVAAFYAATQVLKP